MPLLGGAIVDALASGEVRGKPGDHVLAYATGQPFRRVLAISLGDRASFQPISSRATREARFDILAAATSRRSR